MHKTDSDSEILDGKARIALVSELERRYNGAGTLRGRLMYLWKRYAWLLVIGGTRLLKRLLDTVLSVTLILFLSPVILFIALAIKLYDGGPVLYLSQRVGRWGREFTFPKFRTMVTNAEQLKTTLAEENESKEGVLFKMKRDPRVTPIGRLLRRTSLDELPQLFCVLRGQMGLVGPRPPLPEEVAQYSLKDRRRLDVKPGITCIWQVSGRSDLPFQQQVRLDLEYIESQSLWLDIKLLLRTIPAVIFGRGAY